MHPRSLPSKPSIDALAWQAVSSRSGVQDAACSRAGLSPPEVNHNSFPVLTNLLFFRVSEPRITQGGSSCLNAVCRYART